MRCNVATREPGDSASFWLSAPPLVRIAGHQAALPSDWQWTLLSNSHWPRSATLVVWLHRPFCLVIDPNWVFKWLIGVLVVVTAVDDLATHSSQQSVAARAADECVKRVI